MLLRERQERSRSKSSSTQLLWLATRTICRIDKLRPTMVRHSRHLPRCERVRRTLQDRRELREVARQHPEIGDAHFRTEADGSSADSSCQVCDSPSVSERESDRTAANCQRSLSESL